VKYFDSSNLTNIGSKVFMNKSYIHHVTTIFRQVLLDTLSSKQ